MKLEPISAEENLNFEFKDDVVWGSIPREFIPAIEKGAQEIVKQWVIAWYPIINTRVIAYDWSYHEVDSSEVAFKIATYRAFKDAFMKSGPALLEPIMSVEVVTPDEYMWDVMGDLSSRRGRIEWQEQRWNATVILCKVPLSEMFGYATTLRSISQGRANYSMTFSSYEKVPNNIADKIIEERKGKTRNIDED